MLPSPEPVGHSVEFIYGAWQNGRRGSSSALSLSTTARSRLADLLPGAADVPVIRSWAGVMEQPPDYLPINDIPDRPGNYVVVTASAHGFGITPATGKVVSDLVLNGILQLPSNYELRIFPIAHDGFGKCPYTIKGC